MIGHRSDRLRHRGFTLAEIMVIVVMIGILGLVVLFAGLKLRDRAVSVSLNDVARQLNLASTSFVAAGGVFTDADTANDALLKLQTPVDAVSRKAGFGNFSRADFRWALQPVASGSSDDRLVMTFDPAKKVVGWTVDTVSEGYSVVLNNDATEPAPADWSALVNEKAKISQTGARTSQWVWEYKDFTPSGAGGSIVTTPSGGGGLLGAELNITGPTTIATPGSYYWSGTSSLPGTLTITANGAPANATGATAVQSVAQSYVAGDAAIVAQFDVVFTRAEGGSATRTVTVNIPAKPKVTLTGPDTVTTTDPQTWSATSTVTADPLALRVPGVQEQTGATTVSSTHPGWPSDTHTMITVTASALNGSGFDVQKKVVTINIAPALKLDWFDIDLGGGSITSRGVFRYEARATNTENQPVSIAGTVTSHNSAYADQHSPGGATSWQYVGGGPVGNQSPSTNTAILSVTIDTSSLDPTQWLIGDVDLNAIATGQGSQTAQASRTVHVDIPPTSMAAKWTVTVVGATSGTISSITAQAQNTSTGQTITAPANTSGASSAVISATLPLATYSVVGVATFNNGAAPKYSAPISISVND